MRPDHAAAAAAAFDGIKSTFLLYINYVKKYAIATFCCACNNIPLGKYCNSNLF